MKNSFWQVIRGICILMVILIHTLYLNDSITVLYFNIIIRRVINFCTAVFIFMSGYFSKYDNLKNFYKKKINRLLFPLVVWNIIYSFIYYKRNDVGLGILIKNFLLVKTSPQLYYIVVLIQLFILCPLLLKFIRCSSKKILFLPLLITPLYVIFITAFYVIFKRSFYLYNYWFFGWISFYYLGLLYKENKITPIIITNSVKLLLIITIFFSLLEGVLIEKVFSLYELSVSQLTLSNSIYSIVLCIILYNKKTCGIKARLLCEIGNYSFGIYLSHMIFLRIFKKISDLIGFNYLTSIVFIFSLTVFFAYVLNGFYYNKFKRKFIRV